MAKCRCLKKNGQKCSADAQSGQDVCVFHDPAKTADGQKARRAGGMTRSRVAAVLPPETPDHPLHNPLEVSTFLAESINQVRRGQLDARIANTIGYLSGVLLRALEQGPLEERLLRLEETLGIQGNAHSNGKQPRI